MSQPGEQPASLGVGGLFGGFRRASRAQNLAMPPSSSSGDSQLPGPALSTTASGLAAPGTSSDRDSAEPGQRKASNPNSEKDAEKRLTKLLKKAKPFFDDKLKPKARLQALYAFLEAAQGAYDHDLLRHFVGEHDATVFSVMNDAFWHQAEKIRAIVAKTPDKPPHVGSSLPSKSTDKDSKEVADLIKILNVLRTILLYSTEKIRRGWQRSNIASILRVLLHSANHIRLRIEGLRLLLLWLNDQDQDQILAALNARPPATPATSSAGSAASRSSGAETDSLKDLIRLYKDAVSLGVFLPCWELPEPRNVAVSDGASGVYDEKGLGTTEQLRIGANDPGPLIPAQLAPGTNRVAQQRQDSIDLLEEILYNLVLLARATSESIQPPESRGAPPSRPPSTEPPNPPPRNAQSAPSSPKLRAEASGSSASSSDSAIAHSADDLTRNEDDNLAARALSLQVPAARNLRMMWELFTQCYLRLFFPGIARKFGLAVAEGEGFATCPPEVLQLLLVFLLRVLGSTMSPSALRQASEALGSTGSLSALPGANYRVDYGISGSAGHVLKQMLLGSEGTTEMLHEAVRQSMMVPWKYHEVVALGLGALKCWLFVEPAERPPHLRGGLKPKAPLSVAPTSLFLPPIESLRGEPLPGAPPPLPSVREPDPRLCSYLPRYIRFVRFLFLERKDSGDLEARMSRFKEALMLLRMFALETYFDLDAASWQTLLVSLLEIHKHLVLERSDMYGLFGNQKNGDDLVGTLVDTILVAWVRSGTEDTRLWKALYDQMSSSNSTRYGRTILEWARLMGKLTKALALLSLGVDLDQYAADAEGGPGKRRVFSNVGRPATAPANEQSTASSASADLGDTRSTRQRVASGEVLSERSSRAPSGNATGQFPRVQDLTSPQSLNLSSSTALFVWKNMLCILGNPNQIKTPVIQGDAIKAVVNIYDMLALVRACQPYQGVTLPPIYDFITWIFQACAMPNEFAEGRATAYGCMCRMMCRRPDYRLDTDYYAHFYQLVIKGLGGHDVSVIYAIVNNGTRLFGLQLPGSTILVPPFLKCVRQLFFGPTRNSPFVASELPPRALDSSQIVPEIVRQNIAIILSSIASTCNITPEGRFPILDFSESPASGPDESLESSMSALVDQAMARDHHPELSVVEAKAVVKTLLLGLLQDDATSQRLEERTTSHRYLLNALGSMVFEELVLVAKTDKSIVDDCLNFLLGHLKQHNLQAINATVDCLNLFSQSYANLKKLDQNVAFGVVEKIVGAIQEHLNSSVAGRSQELIRACIVARLFYCLLDWLLCVPAKWFGDGRFLQLVFDTIEEGLNEGAPPPGSGKQRGKGDLKGKRGPKAGEEASTDMTKSGSQTSLDDGQEPGELETGLIRDAAENVLMHVLHNVDNFPPPNGPAMMNTAILDPAFSAEQDPSKTLYFSYNEKTLLAFVEMPGKTPLDSKLRIIVRDIAGRYCWDTWLFYESLEKLHKVILGSDPSLDPDAPPPSYLGVVEKLVFSDEVAIEPVTRNVMPSRGPESRAAAQTAEGPDLLKELLLSIGEGSPDCLRIPGKSLLEPPPVPEDQTTAVAEAAARMKYQVSQEFEILGQFSYPKGDVRELDPEDPDFPGQFKSARPPLPGKAMPPYHRTRLFLSHMGFTNFDTLKEGSFHMLTKSPALFRDIKGLDKTTGRETIKVAVIYVGPGQEDEHSIMRNSKTSADYTEFVASLGWEVDLATHAGYLGGLERNASSGSKATYFCSSTHEIIFHEVTRLPTDPHDPRQVRKKRHIGNDPVHVIWNEHARDYRRNTISGDYANAQIVITPLRDGFYAVDITRDPKLQAFGPLQPHSIVSKASLGALVRATCVSAHRYALLSLTDRLDLYRHSYAQRVANLKMIKERHAAKNWTYQNFIKVLLGVD